MKTVSIILPLHRRTQLLSHTLTSIAYQDYPQVDAIVVEDRPVDQSGRQLCERYGATYYVSTKGEGYNNVSTIYNIGIKRAHGDIIVMQSSECMFSNRDDLSKLVAAIKDDEMKSAVPLVQSLGPRGEFIEWYNHPRLGARAGWTGFFCHAMHRSQLMKIGGYDEGFRGYGHDDDLLLFRMKWNGIQPQFVEDVLVTHQWHTRHRCVEGEDAYNYGFRMGLEDAVRAGHLNVANLGREWGVI